MPVTYGELVNNLLLPACPTCGTVEVLFRTWDNPGAHAGVANAVHAKLVELGYVNAVCADIIAAETEAPDNVAELPWPPA